MIVCAALVCFVLFRRRNREKQRKLLTNKNNNSTSSVTSNSTENVVRSPSSTEIPANAKQQKDAVEIPLTLKGSTSVDSNMVYANTKFENLQNQDQPKTTDTIYANTQTISDTIYANTATIGTSVKTDTIYANTQSISTAVKSEEIYANSHPIQLSLSNSSNPGAALLQDTTYANIPDMKN